MSSIEESLKRDIAFKSDFVLTDSGDLDVIAGLDNIKDAIFRRVITSPGGIIHRPNYGVGIKEFLGSISSLSTQRNLALKIQEQLEQDERIEKVEGVSFTASDERPELVKIHVRVRLVGYGEARMTFTGFGDV